MQNSKIAKRVSALTALVVLLVVAGLLIGCGDDHRRATRLLFAADTANNRVLIYNFPLTTGQSANVALGQASFTTAAAPAPPTAASMSSPLGAAVDAAGNFYVSDRFNCRVLQFKPPFTTGMAATLAVGQASGATNLTTQVCVAAGAATASTITDLGSVAIDASGNLWVSDTGASRVLKYPAPITAGEAATVALGQATTGVSAGCNRGGAASATTLCNPGALAFDSSGNLWVSDNTNNRVLMYTPANQVTSGAATVELGQPSGTAFTSTTANNGGILATSLSLAGTVHGGLVFDGTGNLWVADNANNRVLQYPKASLATNGAAATLELGQPLATAFTSGGANNPALSASTLNLFAGGVGIDSSGRIIVADQNNNRTLVFTPPFTNGMAATLALGQANLTTGTANTGGEGAATQSAPIGVATAF